VGAAFPKALIQKGNIEVLRVIPLYKNIRNEMKYMNDFPVETGFGYDSCVLKTDPENIEIPTCFIGNDRYFYRESIYGQEDDNFRFFFFCKAVVEMLKYIPFEPDIIHANDWHTGFIPVYSRASLPHIKSVFTIHNFMYRGYIPANYAKEVFSQEELDVSGYPGHLDFLKAGIVCADKVTTVSPKYSKEILQLSNEEKLWNFLKNSNKSITGILNGIDTDRYNPENDRTVKYPYSGRNSDNKKKNKTLLRRELNLPDVDIPLVAIVSRIEQSKGIDLVIKAMEQFQNNEFQLVVLGSGNKYYEGMLSALADRRSDGVSVDFNYSFEKACKIYAASDIFVMPSSYEPCGIGQLYAMRYGVVPIVNPVGGLWDTVVDFSINSDESCGFHMTGYDSDALVNSLKKAISVYYTKNWSVLVANCMKKDWSWDNNVKEYIELYKGLIL